MRKNPLVRRFSKSKAQTQSVAARSWHNGGDFEIDLYARSLHNAAKTLIETLDLKPNPKTAWDGCPAILLYRQAVELQLKAVVDEGANFLSSPTDPITLYKTHSVRWLAQIVCQIVRTLGWESSFKCECVASLADFSALIGELEALDPVSIAVHVASRARDGSAPLQLQPPNVVRFAKKLDGLLDLLDKTTDALAATGDQASREETFCAGNHLKPTIQ
jgi:hypothetical protein